MRNRLFLVAAAIALMGLTGIMPSGASAISYECPNTELCNGNEYSFYQVSKVGDTYQFELDIHILPTYTGNKWTDVVDSVYVKNFGSGLTDLSLVSAPGGVDNWSLSQYELEGKGFSSTASHWDSIGAGAKEPGFSGAPFTQDDVLSWVFQFNSPGPLNETVHMKYLYENSLDKKVGSLGSWDYPPPREVPEPVTLLLLGLGLIGVGTLRKKFGR